jgi:hypothetical protein
MNRNKLLVTVLANQGAAAAPFSPSDITGLRLWFKADTGLYQDAGTTPATADGAAIGQWQDQGADDYHVSQAADKRPLLKLAANGINSRPAILSDGSNDILVNATANFLSGDSAGTIAAVFQLPELVDSTRIILASADEAVTTRFFYVSPYINNANPYIGISQREADTQDTVTGSTAIQINTTYIAVWRSNGSTHTLRLNGADETPAVISGSTNKGDWFADTTARDNFSLFALKRSSEVNISKVLLAELVVYGSNLTGDDLTNLETYLNGRYAAYE